MDREVNSSTTQEKRTLTTNVENFEEQTLERQRLALDSMFEGDPEPYAGMWSRQDPVSLFGAWGTCKTGWSELSETFRWVGSRFGGGAMTYDLAVAHAGEDLAYTVGYERGEVVLDGGTRRPMKNPGHPRLPPGGWRMEARTPSCGLPARRREPALTRSSGGSGAPSPPRKRTKKGKHAMSIHTEPSVTREGHAVVIGGSIAGLLAARVLADNFERVTIVERDPLPEGVENRKGVPQGRHAHVLLPRGQIVVGRLFPGLADELISGGAITCDIPAESRFYQPGGYRVRFATGKKGLLMSRPFLEKGVRRRVRALENVAFLPECDVTGLITDDNDRVTGITLRRRVKGAAIEKIAADLVVDAGGRGSRAPAWLEEMGYGRPPEEKIEIGIGYTTRVYRRRPDDLPGAKFALVQPAPPHGRCFGVMGPMEGERWMVTLGGWLGERAPTDEEGFLEFARDLPAPDIYEVIKDAEPLGEAVKYSFPANLRRRYERLARVPKGYLVTGDALCSFNPVYGQGMTVSALEAETLEECLSKGLDGLPRRFYRRVSKVIDTPWQLAAGADFAHPDVVGNKARGTGLINWYFGYVQRAATRDERVCRALVDVTGLLVPPATLFHPRIAWRVFRHALVQSKESAAPQKPEAGERKRPTAA